MWGLCRVWRVKVHRVAPCRASSGDSTSDTEKPSNTETPSNTEKASRELATAPSSSLKKTEASPSLLSRLKASPEEFSRFKSGVLTSSEAALAPYMRKRLFVKPYESTYDVTRPKPGLTRVKETFKFTKYKSPKFYREDFHRYYDICIIGGGIIGCSIAFHLAQRTNRAENICIIERDPTYSQCSTTLSVGGIRQQFSLPENIRMSLFGADFLRSARRLLHSKTQDTPDVNFQPHGYLFLASEKGAETMERNYATQIEEGAKVELLSPSMLKKRFPWINTEDIALASFGLENEGWFDPWALLCALRTKVKEMGIDFIPGDVYNAAHVINKDKVYTDCDEDEDEDEFKRLHHRVEELHVALNDCDDVWDIHAGHFVLAAGAESGHLAHLMGIGLGRHLLSIPLPVEPRKRYVYCFHSPQGPSLDCPLVVDPSGVYFRREGYGGHYLCGRSPDQGEEPMIGDYEVDHDYFDSKIWPVLAHRVPAFEQLKMRNAWAGYYDYNRWDQNAIIGSHPHHGNVFFATGFSGHGLQQAPAIGRAVMELLYDGEYRTIDLTRFQFDRILCDLQMLEDNIV